MQHSHLLHYVCGGGRVRRLLHHTHRDTRLVNAWISSFFLLDLLPVSFGGIKWAKNHKTFYHPVLEKLHFIFLKVFTGNKFEINRFYYKSSFSWKNNPFSSGHTKLKNTEETNHQTMPWGIWIIFQSHVSCSHSYMFLPRCINAQADNMFPSF